MEGPETIGTHRTMVFFLSPVTGQKLALTTCLTTVENLISGISAVGSAGGLGPSGREFESPISDHCRQNLRLTIVIRRFCISYWNYIKIEDGNWL